MVADQLAQVVSEQYTWDRISQCCPWVLEPQWVRKVSLLGREARSGRWGWLTQGSKKPKPGHVGYFFKPRVLERPRHQSLCLKSSLKSKIYISRYPKNSSLSDCGVHYGNPTREQNISFNFLIIFIFHSDSLRARFSSTEPERRKRAFLCFMGLKSHISFI